VAFRLIGRAEARVTRVIAASARRFGIDAADRYGRLMLATFSAMGDCPNHPATPR
jgi:hypothetical protein